MGTKFEQIGTEERTLIWTLKMMGHPLRAIARKTGRSPSSISREFSVNDNNERDFSAKLLKAQYLSDSRKSESRRKPWLKTKFIRNFVEQKLKDRWSPVLISEILKKKHSLKISDQSIYNYIHFKRPDLIKLLPRQGKRIRRIRPRKRSIQIPKKAPKKRSISQRPASAQTRSRFGHWEADTVESHKGKSRLIVLVERKSRLIKIRKIKVVNANSVGNKIIQIFSKVPKQLRRTFTFDRGTENASHNKIDLALGSTSFFCDPQHPWQKGSVENVIGIIRYFFPKNTNFDTVSNKQIYKIQNLINNRPRQVLNYMSPSAVFGVAFTPG